MNESEKETRIYELVMAADHYHETGSIREVLLTCFNQRGKWIGTGVDLPDLHVSANLKRTIIPMSDLIGTNAFGELVLYGTYVVTSATNHVVPYDHIRGDVLAGHFKTVEAPNLKSVGGSLIAMIAGTVRTPRLQTVWNHLFVNCAVEFEGPELLAVGGCLITQAAALFYKTGLVVGDRWLVHPDAYRLWFERETRAFLRRRAGPLIEI